MIFLYFPVFLHPCSVSEVAVSTASVNAVPVLWALAVTAALRPGFEKNVITRAKSVQFLLPAGLGPCPVLVSGCWQRCASLLLHRSAPLASCISAWRAWRGGCSVFTCHFATLPLSNDFFLSFLGKKAVYANLCCVLCILCVYAEIPHERLFTIKRLKTKLLPLVFH